LALLACRIPLFWPENKINSASSPMFATRRREEENPFASGAACNDFLAPLSVSWCKVQRQWIDQSDAGGSPFKLFLLSPPFNVQPMKGQLDMFAAFCEIRSTPEKETQKLSGGNTLRALCLFRLLFSLRLPSPRRRCTQQKAERERTVPALGKRL
jgi:hypothetical protein